VDSSVAICLAIEAPIRHVLLDYKIDNGFQGRLFDLEITGVIQKHPVDTNITLLDGPGRIDAAIRSFLVSQD